MLFPHKKNSFQCQRVNPIMIHNNDRVNILISRHSSIIPLIATLASTHSNHHSSSLRNTFHAAIRKKSHFPAKLTQRSRHQIYHSGLEPTSFTLSVHSCGDPFSLGGLVVWSRCHLLLQAINGHLITIPSSFYYQNWIEIRTLKPVSALHL